MSPVFVLLILALSLALRNCFNGKNTQDEAKTDERRNIILIVTDDQDYELFERFRDDTNLLREPRVNIEVRISYLGGLYARSHRTLNNSVPGNCDGQYWRDHIEPNAFPVHLQKFGYETFFAGKYLNTYGQRETGGVRRVPPGWTHWNGLVGNSRYYNYSLSVNGKRERHEANGSADYLTNVIRLKALQYLTHFNDTSTTASVTKPFFMMICPPAPHSPFTSEDKYETRFRDVDALRTPSFNASGRDKHWLLGNAKWPMQPEIVKLSDEAFRNRWRTLLSVDDMVADIIAKLKELDLLKTTFVIFTSDNGFHVGQFSLPWDKRQLYEFDVRVPLLINGPNIKPGRITSPVLNIDLAPTILSLAGMPATNKTDGYSFVPLLLGQGKVTKYKQRKRFIIEYWGESNVGVPTECPSLQNQGLAQCHPGCVCEDAWNNTYTCVRSLSMTEDSIYCQFDDAERFVEYYDLTRDPYQLVNAASNLKPRKIILSISGRRLIMALFHDGFRTPTTSFAKIWAESNHQAQGIRFNGLRASKIDERWHTLKEVVIIPDMLKNHSKFSAQLAACAGTLEKLTFKDVIMNAQLLVEVMELFGSSVKHLAFYNVRIELEVEMSHKATLQMIFAGFVNLDELVLHNVQPSFAGVRQGHYSADELELLHFTEHNGSELNLQSLLLSSMYGICSDTLQRLCRKHESLGCLRLSGSFPDLTAASLCSGLSILTNLKELGLSIEFKDYAAPTKIDVESIAASCSELQFLCLSKCQIDGSWSGLMLTLSQKLRTLVLLGNDIANPMDVLMDLKRRDHVAHKISIYIDRELPDFCKLRSEIDSNVEIHPWFFSHFWLLDDVEQYKLSRSFTCFQFLLDGEKFGVSSYLDIDYGFLNLPVGPPETGFDKPLEVNGEEDNWDELIH